MTETTDKQHTLILTGAGEERLRSGRTKVVLLGVPSDAATIQATTKAPAPRKRPGARHGRGDFHAGQS